MKNNKLIFGLIITFIITLTGCAAAKYPYDQPVNMVFDKNIRDSQSLLPEIPVGWFVAEDESVPNNISILLLENKYRAAIILSELKISKNARDIITKKGLEELAAISFEMKKENTKDSLYLCGENHKYKIDGIEFVAYDYKKAISIDTIRVLVFKVPETFYELSSLFLKKPNQISYTSRDTLLNTQYTILKRIGR
jgi:hypothetical protein